MPTTGYGTYIGMATTLYGGEFVDDAYVTFAVSYGDKTIAGFIETNPVFGENALLDGTINGSNFSGTTSGDSWDNGGTFSGSFFGPNAEELGGVGVLSDSEDGTIGFSFGAKKID